MLSFIFFAFQVVVALAAFFSVAAVATIIVVDFLLKKANFKGREFFI